MVRIVMVVVIGLGLLLGMPVANALIIPRGAEIVVTTTADFLQNDGACSLREAIQAANTDMPSGTAVGECVAGMGDDTIILGTGVYEIEIEGVREDQNLTGDFDIRSSLSINGQGGTTINGNSLDRVLQIHTGSVTLNGLIITSGHASNGTESRKGEDGGGIYNAGTLMLEYITINANQAGRGGDGGFDGGAGGHGGAIYNTGMLAMEYVTLRENQAGQGGLGYSGAPGGRGGGIYNMGTLTMIHSFINGNRAGAGGPGWNGSPGSGGEGGNGGGIYIGESAIAHIQQSRIDFNVAGNGSDAPSCNLPSVCTGSLRGGNGGNGGGIEAHGSISMINTFIHDNHAGNGGNHSDTWTSSGGHGGSGGGINASPEASATISYSTIIRNYAGQALGRFTSPGVGGGMTGYMTVTTSIIAQNMNYSSTVPMPSDCAGLFPFFGHSLTGTRGCPTNPAPNLVIEGYNPQLGANAELLPGSIAIDAGICPDIAVDFENEPRRFDDAIMPNFGDACDIGADELTSALIQVGPIPIDVIEGGPADALALVLTQPPAADVTIRFANSQVYVGPQTVVFTPETWNIQQQVGVIALDNGNIDFTRIEYIDMTVESTDLRYHNLAVGDLAVQIRDNDAPMIYLPMVMGRD